MRILILILSVLMVSLSCKKHDCTIGCKTECGSQQHCEDGECLCDSMYVALGKSCVYQCGECYIGSFNCGCTDKYMINIYEFDSQSPQVTINYQLSPESSDYNNILTNVTKISKTEYKFLIPRYCDIGPKTSTHMEFIVDKSTPNELLVKARYVILPSFEELATCYAIFTH